MARYTIVLGNKNYSSWSLRGWLPLKQTGAPFEEIVIPLRGTETRTEILKHSPAGKVPVLETSNLLIWDSLAIAEFLAENHPEAGLWPKDNTARAMARSVAAEMHSGFPSLRQQLPMDMRTRRMEKTLTDDVKADIRRILTIWQDCRERLGAGGDFLFGDFGIADAYFAPVVSRFVTYGVPLDRVADDYCDAVTAWPNFKEWYADAETEPWEIVFD